MPLHVQALAESLDGARRDSDPYYNTLIRILATRCMLQAVYFSSGQHAESEYLHYGLAAPLYTHFTSPIRRWDPLFLAAIQWLWVCSYPHSCMFLCHTPKQPHASCLSRGVLAFCMLILCSCLKLKHAGLHPHCPLFKSGLLPPSPAACPSQRLQSGLWHCGTTQSVGHSAP